MPASCHSTAWRDGALAAIKQGAAVGERSAGTTDADDDEAPWHDQTLTMAERMKLAEGKPLRRRLMAAMAQQDCGQCGYDCRNYSGAIFAGKEERLNLCVPGGKETARMLKTLFEEIGNAAAAHRRHPCAATAGRAASRAGRSRDNPVDGDISLRTRLNKRGSRKGDLASRFRSLRKRPRLCCRRLLRHFSGQRSCAGRADHRGAEVRLRITDRRPDPARGADRSVSLSPAPDSLFQLFSYVTGGERRQKAKALSSGEDPDGDAETLDVLAALEKFPGIRLDPEAFVEALEPLQPRLYSISSLA